MPLPPRLQTLLDAQRLRAQPTTPAAVAALWQKAVQSARDAMLPDLSVDGGLQAAYNAGHLAALALLGAYGLRTGSGPGHHELAFAGAAATGHAGLEDLVPDSSEVRGLRKGSMYDPSVASAADRDQAVTWMRRTLPAIRAALVRTDPRLAEVLASYP